ncbi:dihydrofolate reductase family protein [Roseibium sp.]|uniref:dihydrofolate reductase family protein n=1 Tax=Roseibium sp. TaxID=1936156 RepID=UPI003D1135F0
MRKLVVSMFQSLDGFINAAGGEFIGPEWSNDLDAWTARMPLAFDTLLYGRTSWEKMAEFWPGTDTNDEMPEPTRQLGRFMNKSRKIVFSRTLQDTSAWENSELAAAPLEEVIRQEKQKDGKDMVIFSGAITAQSALRSGLVDEIWLLTLPELFGYGTRLFDGHGLRATLQLQEVCQMDTGAVLTRYAVS